ncbi:hypothetical protein BJ508DRAFT_35106 [Ascobolus immersus RN42]|uniref:Uncharacterized protein n=1 Tax=Ascobolus immersus RN42 TaxID=1160509 RepID=A0A3N4HKX0_ASCIM|nr:hypothetical protein BJ508DRAFT_35106 [Ascobolus immersus RN42]
MLWLPVRCSSPSLLVTLKEGHRNDSSGVGEIRQHAESPLLLFPVEKDWPVRVENLRQKTTTDEKSPCMTPPPTPSHLLHSDREISSAGKRLICIATYPIQSPKSAGTEVPWSVSDCCSPGAAGTASHLQILSCTCFCSDRSAVCCKRVVILHSPCFEPSLRSSSRSENVSLPAQLPIPIMPKQLDPTLHARHLISEPSMLMPIPDLEKSND